jgi:hypothetical protein
VSEVLAAVSSVDKEIMAVYFRREHDDGVVTPRFVPSFGRLDYNQYVQLMASNMGRDRDVLYSARRVCFDVVPWPLERVEELEHHLNFNQSFRTYLHPAKLYLSHSDGGERLTTPKDGAVNFVGSDAIRARSFMRIMEVHGPTLRESGRQLWREVLVRLLALTFAVEGRRAGLRVLGEYGLDPASVPRASGVFLLGLLGPRAVQRARQLWRRLPV